jgi:bla regulator protein blaR1
MPALFARQFTFAQCVFAIVAAVAFASSHVVAQASPSSGPERAPAPAQASSAATQLPAWQTAAGGRMEFEVASIHPDAPGASWRWNGFDMSIEDVPLPPGGRFAARATLRSYIQFAYKVMLFGKQYDAEFSQLPKWVNTESFDIESKAPVSNATKDQMRLMMQSLLADRFKLAVHFETHDVPVMALVLVNPGKLGPRLRPHSEGPACDAKIPPVDRNSPKIPDVWMPACGTTQMVDWNNNTVVLGSRNTTLDFFADWIPLIETLDRPVVNQTGLPGRFDIEFNFTPPWKIPKEQTSDAQLDLTGPTFLEGLKDQLGLKLVSAHAPVQILVIDHVEEPTPN